MGHGVPGLHSQEIDSCISMWVALSVFNEALKQSTVLRNNLGCVKLAFDKPEDWSLVTKNIWIFNGEEDKFIWEIILKFFIIFYV